MLKEGQSKAKQKSARKFLTERTMTGEYSATYEPYDHFPVHLWHRQRTKGYKFTLKLQ